MQKLSAVAKNPKVLLLLLTLASGLLVAGLCLPVMTIKTLVFMRNSFSILSGIYDLLVEGKVFLFLLVGFFSVLLPIVKLIFLFAIVLRQVQHNASTHKYLRLLHDHGRWAMLDVFVVALLVVSIKLGDIANVQVHFGFYVFAVAVLMIMWITHMIASMYVPAEPR